ncbi:MAG: class I SAM-dependent methyltransferase [Chitinophagaceae bacterium]|nr:class I SAM-dependent methyltransferase [Chitinophagaceae bacterium]
MEVARRRNPAISFLEEDLEDLPFADNSFDVVSGFNSFQYAGSFESALLEAKRVLKPGGRLVLGNWAQPELSDATNILKAIGTLLPPLPPDHPGPFALSEDGRIEATLHKHGLQLLSRAVVPCPFNYASLEDGVKSFMGTGPSASAINYTKNKELVEETIAKALKAYNTADGLHFLMNHFLVFVAEK